MGKLVNCFYMVLTVLVLTGVHLFGLMGGAYLGGNISPGKSDASQQIEQPGVNKEVVAEAVAAGETTQQNEAVAEKKTALSSEQIEEMQKALRLLGLAVLVSFLNVIALVCMQTHMRLAWWWAFGTLWIAFFGCMTFFTQSEVIFFLRDPWGILKITIPMGLAVTIPTVAVAVMLRPRRLASPDSSGASASVSWISMRSLSLVPLYVSLYMVFGYFVAWQYVEVREYYGGGEELLGFFQHMVSAPVLSRVIPLQLLRGVFWAALVVFLARSLVGGRLRLACIIGFAFAIWMNAQLLLPNPYMPTQVRMIHLLETASSNFVFGFVATFIMLPRNRKLISQSPALRKSVVASSS